MSAWSALRKDFAALEIELQKANDRRLYVVVTCEGEIASEVTDSANLKAVLNELRQTYPDPIEILIRAATETNMIPRSRHTRAYALNRGIQP